MKVLHVVHGYAPSIGGAQRLVEMVSRGLVHDHGDQVEVITTVARNMDHFIRDDGNALSAGTEIRDGVKVTRLPVFNGLTRPRMLLAGVSFRFKLPFNEYFRTLLNGPIVPDLAPAVAQSGADVVMAATFPQKHMYDALRGARRAGIPIVLCGALHVEDEWNFDREMIFRASCEADAYIALTDFERDHVVERGVPRDKVHVIGGGVDLVDCSAEAGAELRRELGFAVDPVVAIVSKHVPRKRFDVVLEAMIEVWDAAPEARLLIAGGRTDYTAELETLIGSLPEGRRTRVTMMTDFPESAKTSIMAAADCLVMPSGRDSFGIVFVEAWACQTPVVGIDIGATRSLIGDGEDGLLVPYEDPSALAGAIKTLLEDPELRRRLGERGYDKVRENYTWPVVVRRFREVYEGVVG